VYLADYEIYYIKEMYSCQYAIRIFPRQQHLLFSENEV